MTNSDPSQPHSPRPASGRPPLPSEDPEVFALTRGAKAPAERVPGPPAHLAANIAAAGRAWDSLAAVGHHVVFEQDLDGRVSIELQDDDGNRLELVGPSQLFDLIDQQAGA